MADASVTAANVLKSSDGKSIPVTFGATITQGQALYKDSADSEWKLGDAGAAATAGSTDAAIALTAGADGQLGLVIKVDPDFDPGFTATEGVMYVFSSAVAGNIAPETDLTNVAPDYITEVGRGKSNGNIDLNVSYTGATVQ